MRWLPRSLLGRVYALYAAVLVSIALSAVALFLVREGRHLLQGMRADIEAMQALAAPVVADAAVIGDYDTIQRLLQQVGRHSAVARAEFDDLKGGRLHSADAPAPGWAPGWLRRWVAAELGASSQEISAGNVVYGRLLLTPSSEVLAGEIWGQASALALLALAGIAAGLVVIAAPLRRWLGRLDRFSALGDGLEGGQRLAQAALAEDAPDEFRRTFEMLGRAASSLQAQREQAAATLQAIDDAVFACDNEGCVRLANDAAQRLLQRDAAALVGQRLAQLLPALGEAGTPETVWLHRRVSWVDGSGLQRVLEANRSPIRGIDGRAIGEVLACRDVTELHRRDEALRGLHAARDSALAALRRVLERSWQEGGADDGPAGGREDIDVVSQLVSGLVMRLRERSEQLDAIFALSPDGFVSFSRDGQVRYASPGFARLTGLSADMVLGLEEAVFVQRLRSRCEQPGALRALAPPPGHDSQVLVLQRPQRRVLALALHRARAEVVAQVLHVRDITRESEVDRLKSEFVAAAAHELRTPMVGIYGFSELLVTRELSPERQKALCQRIHRQCEVMVGMLNEMLDLARLESGRGADFERRACDLAAVVAQTVADFAPPPPRGAPSWQPPVAPLPVLVDGPKLQRALRNLLSNAYKYSPSDSRVEVRLVAEAERVGVAVEDHGIGLTAEQLARIGERFYRADASGAVLGTGLGVSLAREIAVLHGGALVFCSERGRGTVATLWLPRLADAPAAAATTA